ncbi:NADH-quinone oxidoreductase subunit NuoK [Sulfurovum sp. NBC37-1]|uniref:NADH-quinone oxidoreductase subunit NuoK n=1 Tax=Sulfurovum sp. (strain NBC37-1) TaxID=387093 RepID=UPI0001587561|nr:NADH-quinone oxidoreductase subunit K [Sulfurovum sp. NBC37-1]BAF71808.1 NADH-quinone oxidoreductase, chain K [Sulfurovum sp. NBC37-1]
MFETEMIFAFALFAIGLYGVSSGRDFLCILFSLEMLLNAVIMMLAITAHYLGMTQNIALAYMVMVLATLEAAAGVLIFAAANKVSKSVIPDELNGDVE